MRSSEALNVRQKEINDLREQREWQRRRKREEQLNQDRQRQRIILS